MRLLVYINTYTITVRGITDINHVVLFRLFPCLNAVFPFCGILHSVSAQSLRFVVKLPLI